MTPHPTTQGVYHRLVLWNIGLTLVDAARVDRAAYAEAFRATTGRPLVHLPQMAGRSAAGELRDAGADLVLDDLADTEAVLAAVDRLTAPVRS